MLLWPVRLALKIVGAILALVVLYVAVTFVQVWLTSRADDPHKADAVLVFGTAANYTSPAPDLRARLQRALDLYDKGLAPIIAVTGGKESGDLYTEAQISAMWLERMGVPSAAIVLGSGGDTWENVSTVAPALKAVGVRTVLVVTDAFHEDRAMAIATGFGFAPSPTPSQHSPIHGPGSFQYFAKEAVEVAAGRIVGYQFLSNLLG